MAKLISRTIDYEAAEGKIKIKVPSAREALQFQSAWNAILNSEEGGQDAETYEIGLPFMVANVVSINNKKVPAEQIEDLLSVNTVIYGTINAMSTRISGEFIDFAKVVAENEVDSEEGK